MNSPMLDDACPMASTYRHLVAQACQATCHEYYYQTALKRWEEVLNTSNRALSDTLNENLVQMETSLVDHLMAPKYADEVQAAVAVDALGGELRAGVAPHMASATGPGAMPLPRITSATVLRYFADALQILRTGSARRCAPPVAVRLSAPSAAPDAAYASSVVAGRKRTHQQMTTAASKDAVDGTDAEAAGAGGRESNAAKRARVGEGDDAVDTSPAATSAAPAGTVPEPSAATNQAATSHAESVAELRSMCEVLPMVAPSFGSHPRVLSWLQWSASHAQFMELRKREEEELHRLSDEARLLTKAKVSHLPGANVVAGAHFPYSLDLV
ncbi:hypothetical protein EON66_08220 [archaeon]|nr:MAG: hypothetical protein EON66_08220 [archaeon]